MILWTRGDVFSSSPLLAGAVPRSNHRLREVRQVLPALLSDAPPETPNLPCGVEKSEQRNTETPQAAPNVCQELHVRSRARLREEGPPSRPCQDTMCRVLRTPYVSNPARAP